jgi:hypothetical protein
VCGNVSVFCVANATSPTPVTPGYYSVGSSNGTMQANQFMCPAAVTRAGLSGYCPGDGLIRACPAGRFGNSTAIGSNSSLCSGPCPAGYYCPESSTEASTMPCGGVPWYAFVIVRMSGGRTARHHMDGVLLSLAQVLSRGLW